MELRRRDAAHLSEGLVDEVGYACERGWREPTCLHTQGLDLICPEAAQNRAGTRTRRLRDDEVTKALEQVLDVTARVLS